MSLYKIVETFNNNSVKEMLFEELAKYTAKLTSSAHCFFWLPGTKEGSILKANTDWEKSKQLEVIAELNKLTIDTKSKDIIEILIADTDFEAIPIRSSTGYYGIIAISRFSGTNLDQKVQKYQLLHFLSELSAVTIERFYLEDIGDKLLVIEEQNRIANEIHDSVSQRLFSICYAIHGILARWDNMPKNKLKEYFTELNKSASMAMQELRDSIYHLSSKKKGEKSLDITLRAFLDSISKLQNTKIVFETKGEECLLSLPIKKCITRIIREGCGNAIRHGKCQHINIDLIIDKDQVNLSIEDDGTGFLLTKKAIDNNRGLGISNMKNLVASFHGTIEIDSTPGMGTKIQIEIPLRSDYVDVVHGGIVI